MKKEHIFAAIDLGSNAARLLIKHIEILPSGETKFDKLLFLRFPLRLGDDVFSIGKISDEKKEKMIRMIKAFKQLMRIYDVEKFQACATSAMREAKNGKSIIRKIQEETGIKIDIIDGKEEAETIYGSHIELISRDRRTCAYVDVGGGSTEITLIFEGKKISSASYNIGTIRMLHNTEEENQTVLNKIKADLSTICNEKGEIDIVGSGGNINKLYKLSAKKNKEEGKLTVDALNSIYMKLKPLSLEQRMEEYGLNRDRADVIIPAAEIFQAIAETLKSKSIYVPRLGLADGIIDGMYSKKHPITDNVSIDNDSAENVSSIVSASITDKSKEEKKETTCKENDSPKVTKKVTPTVKKQ